MTFIVIQACMEQVMATEVFDQRGPIIAKSAHMWLTHLIHFFSQLLEARLKEIC